jgi:serine/threonine protein kinase
MAPELLNQQPYTDSVDMFAMGCTVHEMATLHRTHEGSNELAIANRIFKGIYDPINADHFSAALQKCIEDLLKHDGGERLSATALLELPAIASRKKDFDRRMAGTRRTVVGGVHAGPTGRGSSPMTRYGVRSLPPSRPSLVTNLADQRCTI